MHSPARPLFLSLAVALALGGAARAEDPKPAAPAPAPAPAPDSPQILKDFLKGLYLAEGLAAEQVILYPLYVLEKPADLEIVSVLGNTALRVAEPEGKAGREWVKVSNPGPKPVLLLGGTVLEGGKRDRVVRFDRIIPSADAADVEVVVAAMAADVRKEPTDFKVQDFLAPSYLRQAVQFSSSNGLVPRFVSHFLEFRNPSDKRQSLVSIGESDALADYCLVCQRSFSEWPEKKGAGTVIGGLAVVRGRAQSVEAYATNQQLQDWFAPVLKSLSFPAAALELRAKKLGLPLPAKDDPKALEAGNATAKDLMAQLSNATFERKKMGENVVGETWVVKLKDGSRGLATLFGGRVVHLALYPDDPFENSLYSQSLVPMDPEDASGDPDDEAGRAELERRASSGARLTEAEKRLLERLRNRPGIK